MDINIHSWISCASGILDLITRIAGASSPAELFLLWRQRCWRVKGRAGKGTGASWEITVYATTTPWWCYQFARYDGMCADLWGVLSWRELRLLGRRLQILQTAVSAVSGVILPVEIQSIDQPKLTNQNTLHAPDWAFVDSKIHKHITCRQVSKDYLDILAIRCSSTSPIKKIICKNIFPMRCWSDLLGNPLWPTNCGKGPGMLETAFIRQWSLVTGVTHSSGAWTLRGGEGRIDFTRAESSSLPSGKLTWQWEIQHLKMYSLVKVEIFHCYVSLPEGNPLKSDHKRLISENPLDAQNL